MIISWPLLLPPETREDRTKRLFRHYTVGSYDSLTSHRYQQGCRHMGTQAGPSISYERGRQGVWRWEVGEEWVVSYLCFSCSKLTVRVGPCRVSLSARLPTGSPHSTLLSSVSDYVIDDKVAILQKRDHEGFGFVLRGAKGNGSQSHEEGTALLVMSCMPCPFLPFFKPPPRPCPVVVYLDLECPRTRPQAPLCCFPFSCGESNRVEFYLVRANGGFHRGMYTGLGTPSAAHPTPGFCARVVRCLELAEVALWSYHELCL